MPKVSLLDISSGAELPELSAYPPGLPGPYCLAPSPEYMFTCTRALGHDGPHVAHGYGRRHGRPELHIPLARWDRDEEEGA